MAEEADGGAMMAALTDFDYQNLAESWIPRALADDAGIFRVDSREGADLVGRNGGGDYSGLAFPYRPPGESQTREYRLRRDHPDLELQPDGSLKEKNKYLSPPGRGSLLYFSPVTTADMITDIDLPIVICEGEKKCLALSRLALYQAEKLRFLPLGLSGVWNWRGKRGIEAGPDGHRTEVKGPIADLDLIVWKGRIVYILFDHETKPKSVAAVGAARRDFQRELESRGAQVFMPALPGLPGFEKTGPDDFLASDEAGPEKLLEILKQSLAAKPSLPPGFRLSTGGLYLRGEDDKPDLWICDRLEVIGMTRDNKGESWGRQLRWLDADGHQHNWPMPVSILAGDGSELRARLLDQGLNISPSRKAREALIRYLQESKPEKRIRCTTKVGWHGDTFVLPEITIGAQQEEVVFQGEGESLLRLAGSLDEWKEFIGRYCIGNSRLIVAVCVALAGPLLILCDEQSGGFHYVGPSSTGKSTALQVGGSVLGGGGKNGFCRSWRATSNGLEAVAEAHNDLTLILDELSQCDPKEAGEASYMLANGGGKARMRSAGGLRRFSSWRLLFLSAGEMTLRDHLSEVGRKTRGGQEVRLLNLPAQAGQGLGIFENLHGFAGADAFARHLQEKSKLVYGTPLQHFLEAVTSAIEEVRKRTQEFRRAFIEKYVPTGASGEASRAAGRFSIIAAAGELAIEAGILPWPAGTAEGAVARVFNDWMEARGTGAPSDIEAGVAQVRLFLEQNGSSRFERESDLRTIVARAGYVRETADGKEYLFLPETFKSEVCKGYSPNDIAKALADRGYLLRGEGDRLTSRVRLNPNKPDDNRVAVYRVSERLLYA